MPVSMLSPLLYLIAGIIIGKLPFDAQGKIKATISVILTKFIIPIVIVYNISTHKKGTFTIMFSMITIMIIMLWISRQFTKDPIQNLSYCYLNIGWLGLPIASHMFGESAAMVIIAAYIGSSLFGNSIGVSLMIHGQDLKTRLKRMLKAPVLWALLIGFACLPFRNQIETSFKPIYSVMKFMMGLFGMGLLGIWLSSTRINLADFKTALRPFILRASGLFVFISIFIVISQHYQVTLVTENKPTLYLLCLLPPAANIIVLETYYMKSGRSASIIACGTCISILAIAIYVEAVLRLM